MHMNAKHGHDATQSSINVGGKTLTFPMNRHFEIHSLGHGQILAIRLGSRKPSVPCVDQDLQELGLDPRNTNLQFALASTASSGGRSCYGYLWNPSANQHPPVVMRLSNLPSDPHERCEHDLTHVSPDGKVLRDLRSFFAPRRVFTARSAWEHLHGAAVEIWNPSKPVGDGCTEEVYDAGNMDAYAERHVFVEVVLQELWSPAICPGSDNVFVGFDPFVDDWTSVCDYCNELHL